MVAGQIQNELAVLLERLPRQDLGEEVHGRIRVAGDVPHRDDASTAHFPQLAIDVARVLRGREAVAEVVRCLAVRAHLDGVRRLVAEKVDHGDHVQQLDGAIAQRNQLGLATMPCNKGLRCCHSNPLWGFLLSAFAMGFDVIFLV